MSEQLLFEMTESQFREHSGTGINAIRVEKRDDDTSYMMLYAEVEARWMGPYDLRDQRALALFKTAGNEKNAIGLIDPERLWPKTFLQPSPFSAWENSRTA